MTVRVHLCCPNPPADAIARVISDAGGTVVDTSMVLDDVMRPDLDYDVLALASTAPGSVSTAEALRSVRIRAPKVRVILLLDHEDRVLMDEAMKAGVYDWTVGDSLARELPELLVRPRSYAQVVGAASAPPAPPRIEFASGETRRIALGFGDKHMPVVERLLEASHAGEYTVVVRASTFEDLVRQVPQDVDGVLTISNLSSVAGFDLETRVRIMAGAFHRAQVGMLLLPTDSSQADGVVEHAGFLPIRGETRAEDRVSFPPTLADPLFRRMAQAARRVESPALPAVPASPAKVWETPAPAPPAPRLLARRPEVVSQVVAVASRLVVVVSPATGVGKTACSVNLATFAGRLGIPTLLVDQSVLPPGNAALRLGIDADEPGLELLLMGPWDEDTFQRLRLPYQDTQLHVLRPISDQVVGTIGEVREGAYDDLIQAAKRQYPLVIIDTSPVIDDLSVQSALKAADRVVLVMETTDDRVKQAVARVPWIVRSTPDPSRILYVINKVGAGGWPPGDVMAALNLPETPFIALPSEPVRHAKAAKAHVPIGMSAGPRDPWARLFLEVAGDIVPPEKRRVWRAEPDVSQERPPRAPEPPAATGTDGRGFSAKTLLTWLKSSRGGR